MKAFAVLALFIAAVSAEVYFKETFGDGWEKRWVKGDKEAYKGDFKLSAGKHGTDKGIMTTPDASFFGIVATAEKEFGNEDKKLVLSYSVKSDQALTCGGNYIKLHPASVKPAEYTRDVPYFIMFGPDQCGSDKKIHTIFNYSGEAKLWKKTPRPEADKLTHVYTLIVNPDNTYEVQVDQKKVESGSLEEDWDFLAPKVIDDPEDKKPEDWVDSEMMDDAEDKKPEDWDKAPETIADPEASQPDDWDEEEDGKWEAPMIPNPDFKGEWKAKQIKNPAYKGVWAPKQIENPAYKPDVNLYLSREPLQSVSIDLWQVEAGSVFDNFIIADNLDEVNAFIDSTWAKSKDAEKTATDAAEEAQKAKDEEARKAAEAEAKSKEDAKGDDEDDEEKDEM